MVLSTTSIDARVSVADTFYTHAVQISLQNLGIGSVYVGGAYSDNGVQTARLDPVPNQPTINLLVTLKDPDVLGPGSYTDVITIYACTESPCVNQIAGSPQTISVSYTVLQATVTLSSTSVEVAGDNLVSHLAIQDRSVGIAVTNPGPRVWMRPTVSRAVVTESSAAWTSPSMAAGSLVLNLRPPSSLGAGTYTDTMKFELCVNATCTRQAAGSPVNVAVTYRITGSELPTIPVNWNQGFITGAELKTAETRSPKVVLLLDPLEYAYEPIYVRHSNSSKGLITGVAERQVAHQAENGIYDITLKPPAALGSGTFTDTMEFEACFDAACTKPVPNSKYTVSLNLLITATEGVEYTRRVMQIPGAREVTWSPVHQSLYVVSNSPDDHRVTQVNPATMTIGAVSALPPEHMTSTLLTTALTPDGGYLYLGSFSSFLYRLKLPSLELERAIPLATATDIFQVRDLAVIPGMSQSIIVAGGKLGGDAGVYVYDDTTPRPAFIAPDPSPPSDVPRWLVVGDAPGTFHSLQYSLNAGARPTTMDLLALDASGLHEIASAPTGYPFGFEKPQRVGSRLFVRQTIADAFSGAMIGSLAVPNGSIYDTLVDEAHGRIFVWINLNGSRSVVLSYDLTTLALLAYADITNPGTFPLSTSAKIMTLWGNDGLALVNGNQLILLSGPFFTTYRGEPTM